MNDLLDQIWHETACIVIYYKLHYLPTINHLQFSADEYFEMEETPDGIKRHSKHLHAADYLLLPYACLDWTRLEERDKNGELLRTAVTKFLEEGESWVCQIRAYAPLKKE